MVFAYKRDWRPSTAEKISAPGIFLKIVSWKTFKLCQLYQTCGHANLRIHRFAPLISLAALKTSGSMLINHG